MGSTHSMSGLVAIIQVCLTGPLEMISSQLLPHSINFEFFCSLETPGSQFWKFQVGSDQISEGLECVYSEESRQIYPVIVTCYT